MRLPAFASLFHSRIMAHRCGTVMYAADAGCTGKRKRTDFVPLASFDDSALRSDYFLLEGAQRTRDAARRRVVSTAASPASYSSPHDLVREVQLSQFRRLHELAE